MQSNGRRAERIKQTWSGLLLGTVALGIAPPAFAQDSAAGEAPQAETGVQDIVVTATRRSTALSKVAASISAVTSDALGAGGVNDMGSLASSVPNLSVGDQFGVNRTFIRGIGLTSIDLGADGAVAFLQDGAIISRPAAQLAGFYDIDRVEVLRGPQGTLYGRGATAGAVNLIPKRPTETLSADIQASYGNYDAVSIEGGVGGPVVGDKILARIAGKFDRRDGYGINLFTGTQIDNRKAYAVRGSVILRPAEDLEIYAYGEHFRERDNNYALHYLGPTIFPENALGLRVGGNNIVTYYAGLGKKPNLRNIYSFTDTPNRRHGSTATGIVSYDTGDLSVKSITSYHKFQRFNQQDFGFTDVPTPGLNIYIERNKTFSEEIVSTYKTGRLDLLFGATYFHESLYGEQGGPLYNLAAVLGVPPESVAGIIYKQSGTAKIDAYGAYAQGTYAFTDKLKVTLGARYSYEKRKAVGAFSFFTTVPTDEQKSWHAITPTLTVNYQASDKTLIYGSATRGFKSGVINIGSTNPPIDPEFAWGYELGVKSAAFDNRLSGSLALFYIDYTDLQVGFVSVDNVITTINAASARNYGAEAELHFRPVSGLTLDLFGTYLNAKYKDFTTGYYRNNFQPTDLSGNTLPNAPKYSVRAGASYKLPLESGASIELRGDIYWQSRIYFTEFNNSDATQAAYTLSNAGLTYSAPEGRYSIGGWVRNIGNKRINSNVFIAAPFLNSASAASFAPPRTYGVTLSLHI